ncbi:hypothetical protein [Caballeronia pedi]|nr:hypothetical protein [Caballeronia pedi]
MPRRDADALALQYRLILEAVRCQRAERRDAVSMAHVVLFTLFLTEAGHGLLDAAYLRKVEGELAGVLKHGEATGEWGFPSSLIEPLTIIVNEHDRQLHEVRLAEIAAATRRLDQRRAIAMRLADAERTATS